MAAFTGQLKSNEIFGALYNMIISQQVFSDNLDGLSTSLVDKARVDGGLYGDTKLYYAVDVLKSIDWVQDSATATNLLELHRPAAPDVQSITLDVFRQIALTVDDYLSKRAWSTQGAFSQFNSQMLGMLRDTKRVYDMTTYNSFIGTAESSTGKQSIDVDISTATTGLTGEEKARVEAQTIANAVANLLDDLKDVSRDYNDYGNLRAYKNSAINVVWNSKWKNKITKLDLPTMFHKDGLVDKFNEDSMNYRYFGTVITSSNISTYSATTPTTGKPINSTTGAYTPGTNNANGMVRSLVERDLKVAGVDYHVFPGDELPAGATVIASTGQFLPGEVYIEDQNVICKIMVKLPPYMSAFEVGTSFFNDRNLSTNHYLTFGVNTLEYLKNYPYITIKAK